MIVHVQRSCNNTNVVFGCSDSRCFSNIFDALIFKAYKGFSLSLNLGPGQNEASVDELLIYNSRSEFASSVSQSVA